MIKQTNLKLKLTLSIFFSIFSGFMIFYCIMIFSPIAFHDPTEKWYQAVKDEITDDEKIFIYGSSRTAPLNSDHIENILKTHNYTFDVYNLSFNGDLPSKRLISINKIISMNPSIVVYGIDDRMFSTMYSKNQNESIINKNKIQTFLPIPKEFFERVLFVITDNLFFDKLPKSPKIVTLQTLQFLKSDSQIPENINITSKRPFSLAPETEIKNENIIKEKWANESKIFGKVISPEINRELFALEEIISVLEKNDIDVILFRTPLTSIYLDWIPDTENVKLTRMINTLSNNLEIPFYDLSENYIDLKIWNDESHVADNQSSLIYSDDISQIIIFEIEK